MNDDPDRARDSGIFFNYFLTLLMFIFKSRIRVQNGNGENDKATTTATTNTRNDVGGSRVKTQLCRKNPCTMNCRLASSILSYKRQKLGLSTVPRALIVIGWTDGSTGPLLQRIWFFFWRVLAFSFDYLSTSDEFCRLDSELCLGYLSRNA